MRSHFAHYNTSGADSCVESAIHAAAKQVLIESGCLVVPEVRFSISAKTMAGIVLYEEDLLSPVRRVRFDRTAPEVTIGDIRPDVVGYRGDKQLLVEMYFRHRVDQDKREKLKRLGVATLEIDLSDLDPIFGLEGVKERVIESVHHKEWLLYPRSEEHIAYLNNQLQERVLRANEKYRAEVECRKKESARLALLGRIRQVADVNIDAAFASWGPEEQELWLRKKLGLAHAVPAFLSAPTYPQSIIKVPPFLFQASIFERFLLHSKVGTTLTAKAIYPCLRIRFKLQRNDAELHRMAINLYLTYLARARFVNGAYSNFTGPYYVEHSEVSLPFNASFGTRYDGEPLLTHAAIGSSPRRRWRTFWAHCRGGFVEADSLLADSPHRALIIAALDDLSEINRPASPHHWAEPLVKLGVDLNFCLELLESLGLLAD